MELDQLIDQFVEADQTLRELIVSIEDVRSSRNKLDEATGELDVARQNALNYLEAARTEIAASIVENARVSEARADKTVESVETALHQSLEIAEQRVSLSIDALVDSSRSLDSCVRILKETSQALAASATSLRALEPETIKSDLQQVLSELDAVQGSQRSHRYLLIATFIASIASLAIALVNL